MRVLVLGAGFGGLELTTRLSETLGDEADVVLIDQADSFVFGFSKLDVMFGRTTEAAVRHPYRDVVMPGVTFVQATIRTIDPAHRHVETDAGDFDGDVLVVALGADVVPEATPGLVEAGHEFYSLNGAFSARSVLEEFDGGRVIVGVTSTPFKCPPAPSETALLVHDLLVSRGVRDRSEVSLVMPLGAPVPPAPDASAVLLEAFKTRDIQWRGNSMITSLDPARKVAVVQGGEELLFDLFLGVPVHRAPSVVLESGLCDDGWVNVDPLTLETSIEGVYALGDVTSAGTPKAGVFAEGHAAVVADAIIARHRGEQFSRVYDGHGVCYVEFGHEQVGKVDVTFHAGQPPTGTFDGPSAELAADKATFGSSRIKRWFSRDWTNY